MSQLSPHSGILIIELYDDKGNFLSRVNIASGALDFFVLDDESVLLCYVSETKRISFAE